MHTANKHTCFWFCKFGDRILSSFSTRERVAILKCLSRSGSGQCTSRFQGCSNETMFKSPFSAKALFTKKVLYQRPLKKPIRVGPLVMLIKPYP